MFLVVFVRMCAILSVNMISQEIWMNSDKNFAGV